MFGRKPKQNYGTISNCNVSCPTTIIRFDNQLVHILTRLVIKALPEINYLLRKNLSNSMLDQT
jgi:hypothetical protein